MTTEASGLEETKTLNDIASDVDNIVNTTIDRQVQGDLLSRNDAKIIKNIFKYYTPLRGKEAEDDIASVIIGGGGLGVKGSDIMTAKGRRSAAETPLGHVMLNAQKAISRSVKNKEFGHSLKRLIEENPDDNFWRVISPDSPKYSKEFDTSYTYVGSDPAMQGQRVSSLEGRNDPNNWVKQLVLRRNSGIAQDKDLLVTKVDGKPVYIEIDDPRLRAAFLSLDGSTLQDWVNKFSVINRWLSMVNTSLNPEFVLGNFARDVQTAIGNLMAEQDMPGGKAFEKQLIGKEIKGRPSAMNAFNKGYRRYDLKDGTLKTTVGNVIGQWSYGSNDPLDYIDYIFKNNPHIDYRFEVGDFDSIFTDHERAYTDDINIPSWKKNNYLFHLNQKNHKMQK